MSDASRSIASTVRPADILLVVQVALLATISWIVPERHWSAVAGFIARALVRAKVHGGRFYRNWLMFRGYVEPNVLDALPAANLAHRSVARMQGFRDRRPGGWHPDIEVVGAEHIDEGLSKGHGVVLWVAAGFTYNDLVTKKGLYEAGYKLIQLSRPTHGLSPTQFGIRVLNPVWNRIEDRYLGERILIRDDDSRSALALLRLRLRENGIVSIAVSDQARRTVEVDMLGATVRMATGPLHLARTAQSVLLPTFTVLAEKGLVVNVETPLMSETDNGEEETYQALAERWVRRFEPYLLEYSDQWSHSRFSIDHEPIIPRLARVEADTGNPSP